MTGKLALWRDVRVRLAWQSAFRGVLPGVLAGSAGMLWLGASFDLARANLMAFVTPLLIAGLRAGRFATLSARAATVLGVLCLAVTALSLAGPEVDGARRWVELSGVRLHVSSQLMPLVLLAAVDLGFSHVALWLSLGAQVLHVLQPDAAQASAFGAALSVLAWMLPGRAIRRLGLVCIGLVGAAAAWSRSADSGPVGLAEGVFARAFEANMWLGLVLIAGVAALMWEPLRLARGAACASQRVGAFAVLAYFAVACLAPLLGHHPTPVVTPGGGPIIGAVLAMVWLGARSAASSPPNVR